MDIRQYLDNPMGKGAIIQGKQLIIDDLDKRFEKLNTDKKIESDVYKDGNNYIFHIKLPSESERDNTYDVVIEFSPVDKTSLSDESIINYNVKFFSNCPSFIFTYAYAYNDKNLFIDFLSKKLDEQVLKNAPVVKNPMNIVNFEKSIYFACKYLVEEKNLNKNYLKSFVQRFKKKDFIHSIRTQAQIMEEIKKAKLLLNDEKEKERRKEDKPKRTKNILNKENTPNGVNLIKPKQSTTKEKGVNKVNKIKPKTSTSKSGVNKIKKIKGKKR